MPIIARSFCRHYLISLSALVLPQNVSLTNCSAAPKTTTRLFSFKCGAREKHSNKTGFTAIYLESTQTHSCSRLRSNPGSCLSYRCEESVEAMPPRTSVNDFSRVSSPSLRHD